MEHAEILRRCHEAGLVIGNPESCRYKICFVGKGQGELIVKRFKRELHVRGNFDSPPYPTLKMQKGTGPRTWRVSVKDDEAIKACIKIVAGK